jgi:hypothetical protein
LNASSKLQTCACLLDCFHQTFLAFNAPSTPLVLLAVVSEMTTIRRPDGFHWTHGLCHFHDCFGILSSNHQKIVDMCVNVLGPSNNHLL